MTKNSSGYDQTNHHIMQFGRIEGDKLIYRYGYRLRPPVLATEPKGYIKREAFGKKMGGYWGFAYYDRELSEGEIYAYDLDLLGVFKDD